MTEQNQDKKAGRLKQVWTTWRGWVLLVLFLLAVVVVLAVLAVTGVVDTGFGTSPPDPGLGLDGRRGKTLWDWMDLLLVPVALALGAAFFTWMTNRREREIEDQRAQTERTIALDRTCEAAYQGYLDRMTELIADGLLESEPCDVNRSIARARTLTVLRQLDSLRKGLLLSFLYESGLVGGLAEGNDHLRTTVVALCDADLTGASLVRGNLTGADLSDARLDGARLEGAYLGKANLRKARLQRADLKDAFLLAADLTDARLEDARLTGADLTHAELTRAKVTEQQLAQAASLKGAILPDGTVHE